MRLHVARDSCKQPPKLFIGVKFCNILCILYAVLSIFGSRFTRLLYAQIEESKRGRVQACVCLLYFVVRERYRTTEKLAYHRSCVIEVGLLGALVEKSCVFAALCRASCCVKGGFWDSDPRERDDIPGLPVNTVFTFCEFSARCNWVLYCFMYHCCIFVLIFFTAKARLLLS